MSIPSVKPDIGSKVLPGDKTGLPWEIWRIILSYLSAEDLCRCSCTCKTWNDLVLSLDSSRWKELYLQCSDWKHPSWPINTDSEPASWKLAYKEQYLSVRFWGKSLREPDQATCLYVLKRRKERKVIRVGRGMEHISLKSALGVANDYDRIEIYPGIYDEQFEMSSKIPFEIIGVGELGSIILVVCVEQIALTGRVSNLVFRAPWFTNFILKIRTGYLQVDNCIFEDGMVYVQNPGSCHIKFCTFRHATVILQYLNSSIIENCEFSKTDSAAVTVEGYPRDDKNWTYSYMMEKISAVSHFTRPQQNKGYEAAPLSAFSTSTAMTQKWLLEKPSDSKIDVLSSNEMARRQSYCSSAMLQSEYTDYSNLTNNQDRMHLKTNHKTMLGVDHLHGRNSCISSHTGELSVTGRTCDFLSQKSSSEGGTKSANSQDIKGRGSFSVSDTSDSMHTMGSSKGDNKIQTDEEKDKLSLCSGIIVEEEKMSTSSKTCEKNDDKHAQAAQSSVPTAEPAGPSQPRSRSPLRSVSRASTRTNSPVSTASGSDFFDDESIGSYHSGSVDSRGTNTSSSDDDDDDLMLNSDTDFSDEEESVIMLTCPEHQQPHSVSAASIGADVQSICSQNQSENIRIAHDTSMLKITQEIHGCLIHRCRMSQCKGAVMVSLQAHAIVSHCDINSVGYGVRCIQNARVILLKNEIHHCRTSGVFMRLAASGLVAGNDIHSNCEAGIDIRKNADPLVVSNRIHHGKRSGIVVLGSGRGQLRNNEIFQNKEAGVYILYRGNPIVSKNQIFSGKAAGVAVNEGGRGYVYDNIIRENQWGGVDIRHGGDPVITQNVICNGMSDGIVIGERGRGSLENNIITGNAGCGVWITAASQPMIHGNQINNNMDTGITFVNRTDEAHEADTMGLDRSDIHSQRSADFWQFINEEQPHHRRSCTRATVEYNSIYHNNGRGVLLMFGDEVAVQCNAIHGNRGDGIHIDQESVVLVKDNSITCNAGNGIVSTEMGESHIRGNGVFDNRDHGICVKNEVCIQENDVVGNQRSAVQLERNKFVTVKQNRLQSLSDRGIAVISVAKGNIESNQVYTVKPEPVFKTVDSKCDLKENKVINIESFMKNNADINSSKTSKEFWMLKDPPARPHIEAPPTVPTLPANQVTTVTRVTVPSVHNCDEGSKLCVIL